MDFSKRTTVFTLILFSLLFSFSHSANALSLSRAPYLQMATPNSITVRWRTDQLSLGEVSYGLNETNLDLSASASNALSLDHEVTLNNLSANQRYYYSVGENGTPLASAAGSVHHFDTPPNNGSAKSSRVWVLGDSGINDGGARAVRDSFYAKEISDNHQADLVLLLGDNAYANRRLGSSDGSDEAYQDALFSKYESLLSRATLWPAMGNHDVRNGNISVYRNIFSLPSDSSGTELYYSFDYANVHFICLDSMESNRDTSGLMYSWLESDLATSNADWLVAYWHHPPYSKGSHNSDDHSREGKLVQMRENFLPLLESYGVDLVLSGHSHSYERSYLIDQHYGDSSTFDRTTHLKDGGDGKPSSSGAYLKAAGANQGAVYVVSGSSSQIDADNEVAFMNGDLHPVMYRSKIEYGSVILDINANKMNVSFLNKDHQVSDNFSIQKGLDNTPPAPDPTPNPTPSQNSLNLQTEVSSNTTITLTWQPLNDASAFLYRITRNGRHLINILASDITAQNSASYQDSSLSSNTDYNYQLIVLDSNGSVISSDTSLITTGNTTTPTGNAPDPAPANNTTTASSSGGGSLSYPLLLLLSLLALKTTTANSHPDLQRSLNIVSEQIQQQPKNTQLYLQRAELYQQHQEWSRALNDYASVQRLDPTNAQLYLLRGHTHLQAGHYPQAKTDLDLATQKQPQQAQAYLYRARLFRALKQDKAAQQDFDQALALQPKRAAWYLERAELLTQSGEYQKALKGLDRGIAEVGALVGFIKKAVDLAQRQKNYKQAITYLEKLPKKLSQSPLWMLRRGKLLQQDRQFKAARQTYQKALTKINVLPPLRQQVRAVQELKIELIDWLNRLPNQ